MQAADSHDPNLRVTELSEERARLALHIGDLRLVQVALPTTDGAPVRLAERLCERARIDVQVPGDRVRSGVRIGGDGLVAQLDEPLRGGTGGRDIAPPRVAGAR